MTLKLMAIINEERKYEYGCVMLYFDFPQMFRVQDGVDPDDLYEDPDDDSFGLEDNPHVTLLFGLHKEVTDKQVKKVLDAHTFSDITIDKLSYFGNPDYDVLKYDVSGKSLHEVNSDLKKLPHTSDFPNYHPHMTVGYLKSGTGKKWVKKLKTMKVTLTPQYATFSKPDKKKTKFKINFSK